MQIMDYLDNMEEEYHKFYPDDPCPMEGGYKASFERFVIESLRAEWDITPQSELVQENGVNLWDLWETKKLMLSVDFSYR